MKPSQSSESHAHSNYKLHVYYHTTSTACMQGFCQPNNISMYTFPLLYTNLTVTGDSACYWRLTHSYLSLSWFSYQPTYTHIIVVHTNTHTCTFVHKSRHCTHALTCMPFLWSLFLLLRLATVGQE